MLIACHIIAVYDLSLYINLFSMKRTRLNGGDVLMKTTVPLYEICAVVCVSGLCSYLFSMRHSHWVTISFLFTLLTTTASLFSYTPSFMLLPDFSSLSRCSPFPKAGQWTSSTNPLSNQNVGFYSRLREFCLHSHFFAIHFSAINIIAIIPHPPLAPKLISGPCLHYSHHLSKFFCVCSWARAHKIHPIGGNEKQRKESLRNFPIYSLLLLRMKKMPYFTENDTETFMQGNWGECLQFFIRIFMNKRSKNKLNFHVKVKSFREISLNTQLSGADVIPSQIRFNFNH
jgi:hypothetical protein